MSPSSSSYDWLGNGFYFWENNHERALDFATNHPNRKIQRPAVLGAVLDLGNCLDMLDTQYIRIVKQSYETLSEASTLVGLSQNKNVPGSSDRLIRKLDCSVIENLHSIIRKDNATPFDSVRGVFVEGDEIYETAGFHDKNHIQICIRNPNCIKGFFVPREPVDWE